MVVMSVTIKLTSNEMLETFHQDSIPLRPLRLAEEITWRDVAEDMDELMVLFSQIELLPQPTDLS